MSDLPVARCGDCLYWQRSIYRAMRERKGELLDSGSCRRVSPERWALPIAGMAPEWPEVLADDWCGEFIHRKLGEQYKMVENYEQDVSREKMELRFATMVKQWRFPTEEG